MSDILTRPDDFCPASAPPPMWSPWQRRSQQRSNRPSQESPGTSYVSTSPVPTYPTSNAAPEGMRQSPAALTEKPSRASKDFATALSEAIELSETMVAEDEAAPINYQTLIYAVKALAPLIVAMELPPPLMLPLQNGGIGAEWHAFGMNIEVRFRNPYHTYTVLEDAQGVVPPFHGRDPHLLQVGTALHEIATRAAG